MTPFSARAPRRALRQLTLALALLAGAAGGAAAQTDTTFADSVRRDTIGTRYAVSVMSGYQWFDEATALYGAPIIGLRVGRPLFSDFLTAGVNVAMARPATRGDMFPWNRQIYFSNASGQRDTTLLFVVSQDVVMATYGAELGARLPLGRTPMGRGGWLGGVEFEGGAALGFTSIWADPEQNRRSTVIGGWFWSVGGGVAVPLPQNTALRIRVDDVVLRNHDRDRLSLSDPLFSDDLFPNPQTPPPAEKSSYHNPRLSVAFTFIPGKK